MTSSHQVRLARQAAILSSSLPAVTHAEIFKWSGRMGTHFAAAHGRMPAKKDSRADGGCERLQRAPCGADGGGGVRVGGGWVPVAAALGIHALVDDQLVQQGFPPNDGAVGRQKYALVPDARQRDCQRGAALIYIVVARQGAVQQRKPVGDILRRAQFAFRPSGLRVGQIVGQRAVGQPAFGSLAGGLGFVSDGDGDRPRNGRGLNLWFGQGRLQSYPNGLRDNFSAFR